MSSAHSPLFLPENLHSSDLEAAAVSLVLYLRVSKPPKSQTLFFTPYNTQQGLPSDGSIKRPTRQG